MKFSIIMPVYNAEKYIKQAVNSILDQDYEDYELILVDDGSVDRSPDIIDEFVSLDKRIKGIHTLNRGVSHARNQGLDIAEGEYILFIDSDDEYRKNAFSDLALFLKEYKNPDVLCFGYIESIFEAGKSIKSSQHNFRNMCLEGREAIQKYSLELITNAMFGAVWSKAYRRNFLNEHSIRMPEELYIGEDYCFNLTALSCCEKWIAVEKHLYTYMIQNSGSIIQRYNPDKFNQMYRMHQIRKDFIEQYSMSPTSEKKIQIHANYMRICMSCFMDLFRAECNMSYHEKLSYIQRLRRMENFGYDRKYRQYLSKTYQLVYFLYHHLGCRAMLLLSGICYVLKFRCGVNI